MPRTEWNNNYPIHRGLVFVSCLGAQADTLTRPVLARTYSILGQRRGSSSCVISMLSCIGGAVGPYCIMRTFVCAASLGMFDAGKILQAKVGEDCGGCLAQSLYCLLRTVAT